MWRWWVVGAVVSAVGAWGAWQAARSRTWQAFGELVPRVETAQRRVALTFDDGPDGEHVQELLGALDAAGAKATFFVVGADAERHPDAVRALVAAGHEVANHSWSHERMVFVSPSWIRRELDDTDRVVVDAGAPRPRWFRPPYCKKGLALPWILSQTGRTTVTWDVEPESDPALADSPDALVGAVRAQVRPGSIVLLHPWYDSRGATREALPALLAGLREDGWALVTVSELVDGG